MEEKSQTGLGTISYLDSLLIISNILIRHNWMCLYCFTGDRFLFELYFLFLNSVTVSGTIWNSYSVISIYFQVLPEEEEMQQKRVLVGTSMTSVWHVALSLLQLQLLAPRHCHLKLRKSCKMWKWPLKIKQLSLSPVLQGRRKKWHAETSVQKGVKRATRFVDGIGSWSVWRGQRKGKKEGCEVKKRRLTQIKCQRRPSPVIWLEVFWTCCAWRGKHFIFFCIPSTHVSNQLTGHQCRV